MGKWACLVLAATMVICGTAKALAPDPAPIPPHLTRRLTVYPAGAHIPEDFLSQAKDSDLGGHSTCFYPVAEEDACDAYVLDIYGEGSPAVLISGPEDQTNHYLASEIFRKTPDGVWVKSGELVITCSGSIQALRRGEFGFAAPRARDVTVDGRQFNLLSDPKYGCPELDGKVPGPKW